MLMLNYALTDTRIVAKMFVSIINKSYYERFPNYYPYGKVNHSVSFIKLLYYMYVQYNGSVF